MSASPPRLAVLLSGSGRTLLNLLDHIERGRLRAEIPLVVASRECLGADRARERGIPTLVLPGEIPEAMLARALAEHRIDWVALAGYLRRVAVPHAYRGRIVNIHPALLPKFGGPGMYGDRVHAAVLEAGERESGCTVHWVDADYDSGPVIAQATVPVLAGDTVRTLADRVFAAECRLYPQVLQRLMSEGVSVPDGTPSPPAPG